MDKKNTMLLTVIAVATLLVAVVGATFAYFSLTVGTDGYSKTTVTGSTNKIPTVTLTNTNKALYLNVNATEMAKVNENQKYYAVTEQATRNTTQETSYDILTITTAEGDSDTKYSCTGTVTVSVSGNMTEVEGIKPGDVSIVLTNLDGTGGTETIDLVSVIASSKTKANDLKINIVGNNSASVKAYVMISNSTVEQDYLAGKELTIDIEASNVACPIQAK